MERRYLAPWALALGILETACTIPPKDVGELPDAASETAGSEGGSTTDTSDPTAGGGSGGGSIPASCGPDGPACDEDEDRDCVAHDEDNAPGVHNPDQSDLDEDGLADPVDLCPSVASLPAADADHDGLGDECDPCRRPAADYGADPSVPGYMRVRNVPSTADADGDGIGDVCDNCIHVPNCEAYGPGSPWQPGDPIADGDPSLCQQSSGGDIGDACQGLPPLPGAAGPVGLGPDDDFDQDGLANVVDACPRSPLNDAIACMDDDDCPADRSCEIAAGLCDHVDLDADSVGDACDSCPGQANPLQLDENSALDDADGDFRGDACELGIACATARDPARFAFYPVAANGWCCTTAYPGDDVLVDPDGVPLRLACSVAQEAAGECRAIPPALATLPGIVAAPPGCEAALADAGLTVETNLPLAPADVGGLAALWPYACKLPPLDQDLDGLGDACDLCPLAFDPENLPYVDDAGTVWPDAGKYCNGAYSLENVCMGA